MRFLTGPARFRFLATRRTHPLSLRRAIPDILNLFLGAVLAALAGLLAAGNRVLQNGMSACKHACFVVAVTHDAARVRTHEEGDWYLTSMYVQTIQ